FTFPTKLQSGASYAVTVATQPTGETCTVGSGTGTATANVTSVAVSCTGETFSISGTISGLSNSGLKLQDYTGGESLSVAANATKFQFANPVPYDTDVDVTVATQPFWETCTAGASNFSGPISSDVTTDSFGCTAAVASGAAATTGTTFKNPAGVAVDASGNVYVADSGNSRIVEIASTGAVTTLLNSGQVSGPEGVAVDSSGNHVYVADTNQDEILEYSGGTVTTLAPAWTFSAPAGVAVDSSGDVYVADTGNGWVEEISTSGTATRLAKSFTFAAPTGIAVDSVGNVYVADAGTTKIVEISGSTVTTLPEVFAYPSGIAVDSAGDIYVADTNDFEVRMITAQGNVATLAGSTSKQGSCTASPPLFSNPFGIAVAASGDLYVSDYVTSQVCKLTPGT
ncbi:MAG: NHL repeat-containing protein, partial [Steroidobacteraceae bacterium]